MTITCPEPAAFAPSAADPRLDAEMACAADCATALDDAGLRVTFDARPDAPLAIVLERPSGEPLRRLSARELLALVALDRIELHAWAEWPELPIPGRGPR